MPVAEFGTKGDDVEDIGGPGDDGTGGTEGMAAKLFVTGAVALGDDLKMARLAKIMAATPMSVEKINKQVTGDLIMVYVGGESDQTLQESSMLCFADHRGTLELT